MSVPGKTSCGQTEQQHGLYHRWAGHFVGLPADRPALKVTFWMSLAWWRALQAVGNPLRHAAWFSPRRWERRLFDFFGTDWDRQVQQRERWQANEAVFVQAVGQSAD